MLFFKKRTKRDTLKKGEHLFQVHPDNGTPPFNLVARDDFEAEQMARERLGPEVTFVMFWL